MESGVSGLTVAIMQPYFVPYAGYFRLFAASDLFVIYDCVQFPRRGWVHRNLLVDASGEARWLTLPIEKAAQNVLIRDLSFAPTGCGPFRSLPGIGLRSSTSSRRLSISGERRSTILNACSK